MTETNTYSLTIRVFTLRTVLYTHIFQKQLFIRTGTFVECGYSGGGKIKEVCDCKLALRSVYCELRIPCYDLRLHVHVHVLVDMYMCMYMPYYWKRPVVILSIQQSRHVPIMEHATHTCICSYMYTHNYMYTCSYGNILCTYMYMHVLIKLIKLNAWHNSTLQNNGQVCYVPHST